MAQTAIAWLRNDLRLADNPALMRAAPDGRKVVALYVHETTSGIRPVGAAGRWWLHQSLTLLGADLAGRGILLDVRAGETEEVLAQAVLEHHAEAVYWNRRYAPAACALDTEIKNKLRAQGIGADSLPGNVLAEPWTLATGQGRPYSVYTPFWKALKQKHIEVPAGLPNPQEPLHPPAVDRSYRAPAWVQKFAGACAVGEAAAQAKLHGFLEHALGAYPLGRDFPEREGTSRLSAHLRFGEISPRQIWHAAQAFSHAHPEQAEAANKLLSELAWRDFNYHQLYYREDIAKVDMQTKYAGMQWREAELEFKAWSRGQTGIPIVDAGMRELWATGFMQNRVRMLTASFLTKNLLVDWRRGEQWFWDCLFDADEANNPGNWQWIAGSGLDASPYFRIFNPVIQGEKFDAEGGYVRRWVPELALLPNKWVHSPNEAPPEVLSQAGIELGITYPHPVADLRSSRARALEAAHGL